MKCINSLSFLNEYRQKFTFAYSLICFQFFLAQDGVISPEITWALIDIAMIGGWHRSIKT
jgi:hypothetical protein